MQKNRKWAGSVVYREDTVDSTNRVARRLAREGAAHGTAVVARMQTAGRGRMDRAWASMPDGGLWFSIVLRPALAPEQWMLLPLAAALAGADACRAVTGADVGIKWPNDLVLEGKKIAGLLVEREGDAAVMGIGINVRQTIDDFPAELREKAGSLEMLTGKAVAMNALEDALLTKIERRIDVYDFLAEYAARCVTIGRQVRVLETQGSYTGTAEGIDPSGALLVRDADGALRRVLAGDVSVRGLMGYV